MNIKNALKLALKKSYIFSGEKLLKNKPFSYNDCKIIKKLLAFLQNLVYSNNEFKKNNKNSYKYLSIYRYL